MRVFILVFKSSELKEEKEKFEDILNNLKI